MKTKATMSGQGDSVKRIPYGIADYSIIRRENYYYVDKTPYLEKIIEAGRYLFFIRPRRFGKSLFVALMQAYFDIAYRDNFDELFEGTRVHQNPTEERGKYLMLMFNFSAVDPEPGKMEDSFLNYVRDICLDFIFKYREYLESETDYFVESIKKSRSASDILSNLLSLCKRSRRKLYVIIDEYDNFANTLLTTAGQKAYKDLTHGPGFFRSFFNVLKSGTSNIDAPVTRSFITGVSPITMDDVTSGYNIGKNVSLNPGLNRMLGFTPEEVLRMLEYYQGEGMITHSLSELMEMMTQWYGNYSFSDCSEAEEGLFNSDMVLYFLDNYFTRRDLPRDLVDRNVRVDYAKLKHLILVESEAETRTTNGNFNRLKEIIRQGEIASVLKEGFPLEKLADRENFISLLYYFGLLTIKGSELDELVLVIPNETIKRLYFE